VSYVDQYIKEAIQILDVIDKQAIEKMISIILEIRAKGGRLFFLGVGGSAANCTMRSTTSARSAAWNATRRSTTSPS
jgi:phosphoheptose isomerase